MANNNGATKGYNTKKLYSFIVENLSQKKTVVISTRRDQGQFLMDDLKKRFPTFVWLTPDAVLFEFEMEFKAGVIVWDPESVPWRRLDDHVNAMTTKPYVDWTEKLDSNIWTVPKIVVTFGVPLNGLGSVRYENFAEKKKVYLTLFENMSVMFCGHHRRDFAGISQWLYGNKTRASDQVKAIENNTPDLN